MKRILIVTFLMLWTVGLPQNVNETKTITPATPKSIIKEFADLQCSCNWQTLDTPLKGVHEVIMEGLSKLSETIKLFRSSIIPDCIEPPKECPNANITFWYYSRSNPEIPIQLMVSDLKSKNSSSKTKHPWKIIIHGYTKSKNDIPNPQLRSAYFKKGQYNLISVDYEPLARDKCYIHAVANVPLIANCTAQMIDALIDKQWFNSNDLHVIGFSLGAHIAGLIHTYMKHPKPNRVTGLDPASPLFDGFLHPKLNATAGEFVDVIHTNALIKGKLESAGHVDFYVNGGFHQPGCLLNSNQSFSTCSHDRSPLYFAESINSEAGFWGFPCDNYLKFYSGLCNTDESKLILMGEYVPREAKGSYYLKTSDKEPFALGKLTTSSDGLKKYIQTYADKHRGDFP